MKASDVVDLLNKVEVDCYGIMTPLPHLSTVTIKDDTRRAGPTPRSQSIPGLGVCDSQQQCRSQSVRRRQAAPRPGPQHHLLSATRHAAAGRDGTPLSATVGGSTRPHGKIRGVVA
jgi:hypothetical protein